MPQGPISTTVAVNDETNASVPLKCDILGSQYVGQRHGKYYGAANSGDGGWGANQAGATTSAGLATTYTGLVLSNPAGSGKNLVVQKVSAIFDVAPAALTGVGLIVGYAAGGVTVHTTPLTVENQEIGASASALVGLVDAAATLVGTPAWRQWLTETPSATGVVSYSTDIDGEIILPPGAYLAIGTTIAGPTSGFWGSISWEELALANG